jgi:predicted amidohydrolase YtcJ
MNMKGYINCKIHGRKETAFLVDDGRFVTFGTDQQIEQQLGWQDETIDCHGMYALPGLIAGGMHILDRGRKADAISLAGQKSFSEVKELLSEHRNDEKITAYGYHPEAFEGELERIVLDEIFSDIPIIIYAEDGTLAVLNSKALELADPDLDSEKEGDRGILTGKGLAYVYDYLMVNDPEEIKKAFLRGCADTGSHGVTTAVSDDFHVMSQDFKAALTALEQLAYQQKLPLKVVEDGTFRSPKEYAAYLDGGYTEFVSDYNLYMGRLTIKADGSLATHTAALKEPYQDRSGVYGVLHYTDQQMEMMTTLANHFNTGTSYEAYGDGAVDQVLDIAEDTMYEDNPLKDMLSPCALLTQEHLDRIRKNKLACGLDPSLYRKEKDLWQSRASASALEHACPVHSLYESVPVMGIAADGNVLQAIEDAVMREGDEKLSVDEAISLYTDRAAEALMIEDHAGSFKEDHDADFVILEQDPHTVRPEEIHAIRVMITSVKGETVFER